MKKGTSMIYHILKAEEWEHVRNSRVYAPMMFEQEGFIHLCMADQLAGVVDRYFSGQEQLALLCVEPEALVARLQYENLVGGEEQFPHLYGPLNLDAVRDVIYFRSGQDPTTGHNSIDDISSRIKG
jgi:uncharacterized protein (DUF952 family)